jgi:serine phosphatase RsbU (regulator of sigma subunit)
LDEFIAMPAPPVELSREARFPFVGLIVELDRTVILFSDGLNSTKDCGEMGFGTEKFNGSIIRADDAGAIPAE